MRWRSGAGRPGKAAVRELIPSRSPSSLGRSAPAVEALVLDESFAVLVPVVPDPLQSAVCMARQGGDGLRGKVTAIDLLEHCHEQRRRVDAADE